MVTAVALVGVIAVVLVIVVGLMGFRGAIRSAAGYHDDAPDQRCFGPPRPSTARGAERTTPEPELRSK